MPPPPGGDLKEHDENGRKPWAKPTLRCLADLYSVEGGVDTQTSEFGSDSYVPPPTS